MAEILTESFCERCGSRYTFESAVPRARLRGVKVLSRGLKNFVLDDKTSIDEAMAAARDDTDRSLTSQQLEAFHKTFNFCMSCRQYICPNCWNEGEGQCLTCSPTLGRGILPAPFPHLDPSAGIAAAPEDGLAAAAMNGHTHVADGSNGNGFDAISRLDTLTAAPTPTAPPELIGSTEVEARTAAEPEATAAESPEPGVEAEATLDAPVAEPEPERFIYDPYDPPPPAPREVDPGLIVGASAIAAAPELVGAEVAPVATEPAIVETEPAVVEAGPDVVAESVAAEPVEPAAAAQDVVEADAVPSSDEIEAESDRAAALAAQTTLLLAGLRPGESLDEALAAFEAEPADVDVAEAVVADALVAEPAAEGDAAAVVAETAVVADEAEPYAAEALVADEAAVADAAVEPEPVVADAAVEPELIVADAVVADEAEPIAAEDLAAPPTVAPEPVVAEAIAAEAIAAEVAAEPEPEAPSQTEHPVLDAAALAILAAAANAPEAPIITESAPAASIDAPVEAEPEPVALVEPLDEILAVDSVAAESPADAEAEPEAAWQAEPLDDIVAAEAAVEPIAEAASEQAAAVEPVAEAAPEPVATEAAPEPTTPAVPESPEIAAAAADDVVAQPTWSILAPDPLPVIETPGPLADGPGPTIEPVPAAAQAVPPPSAEPSWPAQPQWPSAQSSAGLPFLGRPPVPTGGVDALWAESSQAVSAPLVGTDKPAGGVQPCTSCGLSLSASARFCRRCGTSQVG